LIIGWLFPLGKKPLQKGFQVLAVVLEER